MSNNQISTKGIIVWLICSLFFMYECLLRTVCGTFQAGLTTDLHLNAVTFALLSSTAYCFIFGPMQIPVGILIDKFGVKKTLFSAALICSLATFGFSTVHSYHAAIGYRVFMGLGSSFGFVCLLVSIYDWMPRHQIATFIGISQFIGTLGPMVAAGPLADISISAGINYRDVFLYISLAGFLIAFLVLIFVQKNRRSTGEGIVLTPSKAVMKSLTALLKEKQVWYIAIYSACVYFCLEYFSENECVSLLMAKGFDAGFASYMITVSWLSYAFGCAILGFVSDRIKRRKSIMVISAFCCLIALSGIIYISLNAWLTILCFVFLGVGASGQNIGFVIMAEQCKENSIPIGLGFNNAMIVLFNAILPPILGLILTHLGQFYSPIYTYEYTYLIIVTLALISIFISSYLIKETFCKSTRESTQLLVRKVTI